ncbi:MAG: hypothetical protein WC848_02200 [Parcubacteria group bacterium]|jgi:hypothetical protein
MENIVFEGKDNILEKVDLDEFRKKMMDEIHQVEDEMDENGASTKELREKRQRMMSEFVENLKIEKEKFKLVFETEKGSVYFVSKDGQSWRFKRDEDGKINDQPIVNKIFFVSDEEAERILEFKRADPNWQENIIGFEIRQSEFKEGVRPVEMGIKSSHQKLFFEEGGGKIKLAKVVFVHNNEEDDQFAAGIHIGHAVSRIWKK